MSLSRKRFIAIEKKFFSNKLVAAGVTTEALYLSFYFFLHKYGELNLHIPSHLNVVIGHLLALYLVYFWILFKSNFDQNKTKIIFVLTLIFHLSFMFTPFFTSNDLHSYIAAGRVVNHNANPYLTTYSSFPKDAFYPIISNFWSTKTTLYGPLFLLIASFINVLGHNHYYLTVILFKSLLIGINLLNIYLIYKITRLAKAVYLYCWHPIIVYELAANAHNESLLIFFLLLALWFVKNKHILRSFFFLLLSVLLKYSSIVIAPLYVASLLKANITARKKCSNLVLIGAVCLMVAVIVYWPFWQGKDSFIYLLTYYRGQTISPSLGIWLLDQVMSYTLAFKINSLLFMVLGGFLGLWFLMKKYTYHRLFGACLGVYIIFILTKLSLVLSWYLTPIIALSAVNLKKYQNISLGVTFAIATYHLLLYWFVK